jgi:hypothetical protein
MESLTRKNQSHEVVVGELARGPSHKDQQQQRVVGSTFCTLSIPDRKENNEPDGTIR